MNWIAFILYALLFTNTAHPFWNAFNQLKIWWYQKSEFVQSPKPIIEQRTSKKYSPIGLYASKEELYKAARYNI